MLRFHYCFPKQPVCQLMQYLMCFAICYFANICQKVETTVLYFAGLSLSAEHTHKEHVRVRLTQTNGHVSLSSCSHCLEVEANGHKMFMHNESQLANQNHFMFLMESSGATCQLLMYLSFIAVRSH